MKNLRKVLAVVLVICMAFSLVTVASAKFTDDADIKYDAAVGVMTGIGAIGGYPDGSFNPTGSVTRAEAAKMVCYAILTPTVANVLPTVSSSFADVANTHWAVKYIEYCVGAGIINGKGNGVFDPNGSVTGIELAKMMLCAAGLGKMDEYVGNSWSFNVLIDAMANNVFVGNDSADYSAAATREEAALYVYNAMMNVGKVTYNSVTGYGTPTAPIGITLYKLTAAPQVGIITGNTATGATSTMVDLITLATDGTVATIADAPVAKDFTTSLADIGKVYNMYYNSVTGHVYYAQQVSTTVTVASAISTSAAFATAFGAATAAKAPQGYVFANYAGTYAAAPITIAGYTSGSLAAIGTYVLYAGEVVSYMGAVASSFDKVDAIVTTSGSEEISLYTIGDLDNTTAGDEVLEYTGIAVGDYVIATQIGAYTNLTKAASLSGLISEVGASNAYVVLGGVKYMASSTTGVAGLTEAFPSATQYATNTYKLYLDQNNNFIACVDSTASATVSSVVYVTGSSYGIVGNFGVTTYYAQAVNSAGDAVVYNFGTSNPSLTAGFKKITVNSTTGIAASGAYSTTPATDMVEESAAVTLATTAVTNQTGFYYASDVTFVFVDGFGSDLTITKVKGLAAAAGNALTTGDLMYISGTGPNYTVNTVIVTDEYTNPTTTTVGTGVMYVPAATAYTAATAAGYVYSVYIDGVMKTITCADADLADFTGDATTTTTDTVLANFATYTVSATGVYDITAINTTNTENSAAIVALFSGYFTDGTLIDAMTTGAKVVDLRTGGTVSTVAALETLVGDMTTVTVAYSYTTVSSVNTLSTIYILSAV